jgi:DNA-binding NtrC family response regulator
MHALHQTKPFDLVIGDLESLGAHSISRFRDIIRRYRKANPHVQFIVLTAKATVREAISAVKAGAHSYLTYPVDREEIRLVVTSLKKSIAKNLELDYLRDQFWKTEWLEITRTRSRAMQAVFENLQAVAPTMATVLMQGETGTGKGLLARMIHWHSPRSRGPFIHVHCGSIVETLIESELFGHEKGAFTGAIRKKMGRFEMARGGTIFLDEIGTVPASTQVKLLQVVQHGTFNRVGGEEELKADVRIIAATNEDLKQLAEAGRFRMDLYYRLNVFPLYIPPLRERAEDIATISATILKKLNQKYRTHFDSVDAAALAAFRRYHWTGNIRELENVLERAVILEESDTLLPKSFPAELFAQTTDQPGAAPLFERPIEAARRQINAEFERHYLQNLLARNAGKIAPAAQQAGVTPRQLHRLLTRHAIDKTTYKRPSKP